jgi:adenylate cyclase
VAKEIERKFLVTGTSWRKNAAGRRYRQGYLSSEPERSVRVRIAGRKGLLTIKGISRGASRDEFEYPIPLADAATMLDRLCRRPLIEKIRYKVSHKGLVWEIDVFEGENRGLVVAEVELKSERQKVPLPPWVGREVTRDARYFNSSLARKPFRRW